MEWCSGNAKFPTDENEAFFHVANCSWTSVAHNMCLKSKFESRAL